jgi:hypothetical protein
MTLHFSFFFVKSSEKNDVLKLLFACLVDQLPKTHHSQREFSTDFQQKLNRLKKFQKFKEKPETKSYYARDLCYKTLHYFVVRVFFTKLINIIFGLF